MTNVISTNKAFLRSNLFVIHKFLQFELEVRKNRIYVAFLLFFLPFILFPFFLRIRNGNTLTYTYVIKLTFAYFWDYSPASSLYYLLLFATRKPLHYIAVVPLCTRLKKRVDAPCYNFTLAISVVAKLIRIN